MRCTNKECVGGYVRKFRRRMKNKKAMFYDELCPECKGNWYEPFDFSQLDEIPKDKKQTSTEIEVPF